MMKTLIKRCCLFVLASLIFFEVAQADQNRIFYSGFDTETWHDVWTLYNGGDSETYPNFTWCQSEERPDPPANNDWSTIEMDNPPFIYCWPYEDWNADETLDDTWLEILSTTNTIDATTWNNVYLLFNYHYYPSEHDNPHVQVSIDDGTTWTTVASYSTVQWFAEETLDISSYVANSSFMVRFYYEATGEAYQWVIDEVQVWGSDGELDLTPPSVGFSSTPACAFEEQDLNLVINASDNVELEEVVLVYAKLVNGVITDETELILSDTETPGEFPATIPSTFYSINDTIVYYARATDGVGYTSYSPENAPEERYSAVVFAQDLDLQMHLLDNFTWVDTAGSTIIPIDVGNIVYCSEGISFASLGLDNFTWYGEEITHIYCGVEGWVILNPTEDESITTSVWDIAMPLPSSDCPYNVIQIAAGIFYDVGCFRYQVDGTKLILTYTENFSWDTFSLTAQLVLDTEQDIAYLSYQNFEWGAFTNINIGFQSASLGLGETFVDGYGFENPDDEQTYSISQDPGYITGTVINNETSSPIENAEIKLLSGDVVIDRVTTNSIGSYSFNLPPMNNLTLFALCGGFEDAALADVEVPIGDTNVYNFSLEPSGAIDSFTGTVISADTEDQPVEGARVTIVALGLTSLSEANGNFTFNDIPTGIHDFEISFDTFDGTYHQDQVFENVPVDIDHTTGVFPLLEVLPPRNLSAIPGEMSVDLSWDVPQNHVVEDNQFNHHSNSQSCSNTSLDDFDDFCGYKIRLDGNIIEELISPDFASHQLYLGDNLVDHTIAVAADYGYGDEYLVFSDDIITAGTGTLCIDTSYPFNWIELRPSEGGNGTPLGIGDGDDYAVSNAISMDGMSITHYGNIYNSFYICATGLITYNDTTSVNDPGGVCIIPSEEGPNAIVAPLWAYYIDENNEDTYDIWYNVDPEGRQIVVQWSMPLYPCVDFVNIHDFQLVIYPDQDTYIFQYLHSTYDWLQYETFYMGAIIGIENTDGTEGFGFTNTLADSSAFMVRFLQDQNVGTVTATTFMDLVETEDAECSGVGVKIDNVTRPGVYSDDEGVITFNVAEGNDHTIQFFKDGLWPSPIYTIDIAVDETIDLGQVFLKTSDLSISPTSLELEYIVGESEEVTGIITVSSTGSGGLAFLAGVLEVDRVSVPTWINVTPDSDTLESGGSESITFTVDTEDENLPTTETVVIGYIVNVIEADTTTLPVFYRYYNGAEETGSLPDKYRLYPGRPNPFNPSTVICYDLVQPQLVSLKVYNMLGQQVASLVNRNMPAGRHAITFQGDHLASGLYLVRIDAGEFHGIQKIVLLK